LVSFVSHLKKELNWAAKLESNLWDILDLCEIYNPDPEPFRHEYELDRDSIEETYLQIQKFLEDLVICESVIIW
jgi:hypothetical protein